MSEPAKTGCSRWVKAVLFLSLGANLLIAGAAIGIAIGTPPARERSPDAVAFLTYALPQEYRSELRQQLVSRRAELQVNRAALVQLRRQMVEALRAEPFDFAAVESILQQQRDRFLALGETAHSALLERIKMLTPEERAVYAKSLMKSARRNQRR